MLVAIVRPGPAGLGDDLSHRSTFSGLAFQTGVGCPVRKKALRKF